MGYDIVSAAQTYGTPVRRPVLRSFSEGGSFSAKGGSAYGGSVGGKCPPEAGPPPAET